MKLRIAAATEPDELLKVGGPWLGAARRYLQWYVKGGDSVTWGSGDLLTLSTRQIDELASHVAAEALRSHLAKERKEKGR